MSVLELLIRDLRERRLWPAAVVLVLAIVAVPVVLAKSAAPAPAPVVASQPPPSSPASAAPTSLNVTTTAPNSKLAGPARDPFHQLVGTTTQSVTSASATATSPATGTSSTATTTTPSVAGSSTTGSGATATAASAGTPTTSTGNGSSTPVTVPRAKPIPLTKPTAAPGALAAKDAYGIALALTTPGGRLNTIKGVERLNVLPSVQQPLLVELGVLQGGKRVLFLVQPGTVVSGPGSCFPKPTDCEILSLGQDQIEGLSQGATPVAQFAVTSIYTQQYPSVGAAAQARRQEFSAGRSLVVQSKSQELALFPYNASLGVVVERRTSPPSAKSTRQA